MKLQKMLAQAYSQEETTLGDYIKKVLNNQKQIENLEDSKRQWEQKISNEITNIIKNCDKYKEVKKLLNITLYEYKKENKGTLLEYISTQIAESLAVCYSNYRTKKDSSNWNVKSYYTLFEEFKNILDPINDENIDNHIDHLLNPFLKEFNVEIRIRNNDHRSQMSNRNVNIFIEPI